MLAEGPPQLVGGLVPLSVLGEISASERPGDRGDGLPQRGVVGVVTEVHWLMTLQVLAGARRVGDDGSTDAPVGEQGGLSDRRDERGELIGCESAAVEEDGPRAALLATGASIQQVVRYLGKA